MWLPLMRPPLRIWPTTQACTLIGNQTSDPLVHRLALNPLSYTSQGYIASYRWKTNDTVEVELVLKSENLD